MAERTYSGTAVAFEGMTLPEIRDPVAAGPGPGSMRAAEQALVEVARKLEDVDAELAALEREYADAHEGEAAEATRTYLRKLGEPGRVGTVMFRLAARALGDQAEYYTVARRELAALPANDSRIGNNATSVLVQQRRQAAVHLANRYQENSNANLASAFQAFTPLMMPTPDTAAVAPAAAVGWPQAAGAGVPSAAGSVTPPAPGGATPGPPGAAPLAVGPALAAAPDVPRSAASTGTSASGAAPARPPGVPPVPETGPVAPTPLAGLDRAPASAPSPPSGDRTVSRTARPAPPPGVLMPAAPRPMSPRTSGPGALDRAGGGPTSARPGDTGPGAVVRTGELAARSLPGETHLRPGDRLRAAEPPTEPARPASAARGISSNLPYLPAGVSGGRRGELHPRPHWLVEEDPDGVWSVEVPRYGPGVLRGEEGRTGSGM